MPAVKGKKGTVPTNAVNQPYQPVRKKPQLHIPESVTAYGDESGMPLFRFGDRKDGVPEQVSVTPMSNAPSEATPAPRRGKVTSMANGGFALISSTPQTPQQKKEEQERRNREMFGALTDSNDIVSTAYRQYVQNASDERFSQYGVQAPVSVSIPRGYQGATGAFVRNTPRTNADYLQEQYNLEDLQKPVELDQPDAYQEPASVQAARIAAGARVESANIAARARMARYANQGEGDDSGGSSASQSSRGSVKSGGSAGSGLTRIGGHNVTVVDPSTGNMYQTSDDNEVEARRTLKARAAKRQGLVEYSDPFNPSGEPEYLPPAEAKLREMADDQKMKQELERRKPGNRGQLYPNLSDSELVSYAVEGGIEEDDLKQELRARGFEEEEIDAIVRVVGKRMASKDKGTVPQREKALDMFDKEWGQLSAAQKQQINDAIRAERESP